MRAYALGVAVWFALCGLAQAQPSCGEPPRVDDLTLKGDLEGKAQFLSKLVGDADLKGKIEAARTDIFSKYPKAGEAHSDAYLEYLFCSFVLSDPKLSGQEKFHAILDFRQAEREPVKSSQTAITHGDQSPAVNPVFCDGPLSPENPARLSVLARYHEALVGLSHSPKYLDGHGVSGSLSRP
jgi:hypothetical protein